MYIVSDILHLHLKPVWFAFFMCICSNLLGHKLLIWLGGGFQNLAYEDQVGHLAAIQKNMGPNDRILLALDLNQDETIAKNAYLDPKGTFFQVNFLYSYLILFTLQMCLVTRV